jgi:hypothetical protein
LKLILDEFNFKVVRGSVSYLQTSLTLQIETVETNIGKCFGDLKNSSKVLNDRKPSMDATIDDLRLELGALRKRVNRVVINSGAATSAGILSTPGVAAASSSAGHRALGPSGHHVELCHRESGFHTQLPVKTTLSVTRRSL